MTLSCQDHAQTSDRLGAETEKHTYEDLVLELARVLHHPDSARELALRAGFPPTDLPAFDTPIVFWSRVLRAAGDGKIVGGVGTIVEEAKVGFPGNQLLARYGSPTMMALEPTARSTGLMDKPKAAHERTVLVQGHDAGPILGATAPNNETLLWMAAVLVTIFLATSFRAEGDPNPTNDQASSSHAQPSASTRSGPEADSNSALVAFKEPETTLETRLALSSEMVTQAPPDGLDQDLGVARKPSRVRPKVSSLEAEPDPFVDPLQQQDADTASHAARLISERNFAGAERVILEHLSKAPLSEESRLIFIDVAIQKQDLQLALSRALELVNHIPGSVKGLEVLCRIQFQLSQYEEALSTAKKWMAITPNDRAALSFYEQLIRSPITIDAGGCQGALGIYESGLFIKAPPLRVIPPRTKARVFELTCQGHEKEIVKVIKVVPRQTNHVYMVFGFDPGSPDPNEPDPPDPDSSNPDPQEPDSRESGPPEPDSQEPASPSPQGSTADDSPKPRRLRGDRPIARAIMKELRAECPGLSPTDVKMGIAANGTLAWISMQEHSLFVSSECVQSVARQAGRFRAAERFRVIKMKLSPIWWKLKKRRRWGGTMENRRKNAQRYGRAPGAGRSGRDLGKSVGKSAADLGRAR